MRCRSSTDPIANGHSGRTLGAWRYFLAATSPHVVSGSGRRQHPVVAPVWTTSRQVCTPWPCWSCAMVLHPRSICATIPQVVSIASSLLLNGEGGVTIRCRQPLSTVASIPVGDRLFLLPARAEHGRAEKGGTPVQRFFGAALSCQQFQAPVRTSGRSTGENGTLPQTTRR